MLRRLDSYPLAFGGGGGEAGGFPASKGLSLASRERPLLAGNYGRGLL